MARFKDEGFVAQAFQPHLHPGEQIQHLAYGVKQPPIWLILLLFCLAILPGAIATAILTKEYVVALTGQRFIVLLFSGGKIKVKEVKEYWPQNLGGKVKTSKGAIFTHIRIDDGPNSFVAKFHRMGMPNNKQHAEAMADMLQQAGGALGGQQIPQAQLHRG